MARVETAPNEHAPIVAFEASAPTRRFVIETVQAIVALMDLSLIVIVTAVSHVLAGSEGSAWVTAAAKGANLGLLTGTLVVGVLVARRGYGVPAISDVRKQAVYVVQAWLLSFFVLGWFAFLMKVTGEMSRAAVSIQFGAGLVVLVGVHVFGARWLATRFSAGRASLQRVVAIAVASDPSIDRIRRRMAMRGIELVSVAAIDPAAIGHNGFGSACRHALGEVKRALARDRVDGIYVFMSWLDRRYIDELKATLNPMPVPIYLFADRETEGLMQRPKVNLGGMTGFEIERAPLTRADRMAKRCVDVTLALVGLLALSPLFGLVALGIWIDSGRPIFFRQKRKGFGARPFEMVKFRTMTVQENGPSLKQATRNDPRVTRLGRILRRTSVDELPQLINVLKGDMSIVGPRPHAIAHDDHYDQLIATYALRQHVKPGITGWAQVNGHRGETRELGQMSARVEHDLWYISNWSMWLDFKIIAMTAMKVFVDEAY